MHEVKVCDLKTGDYNLIERIGAGGMGEVWRAENVHTRVPCAVKLLPADATADKNFVARFFDEGRVMQTLEHPNIVRVHHVGHDEKSGRYFLVEDLILGKPETGNLKPESVSLHDLLQDAPDNRLPEKDVSKWAIQVAEALAYAHEKGVIHRDIKPANVLIDADGNAKVTDFGLAKAIGEGYLKSQIHISIAQSMGAQKTTRDRMAKSLGDEKTVDSDHPSHGRTTADALLGTYDYMSPEQRGELTGIEVTPASDVYAFGVMLYRMLTGRRPAGKAKDPSVLVKGLSKTWDIIADKCLEHRPEERYRDGGELARAVACGGGTRVAKIVRKILKAAVFAALLGGLAYGGWRYAETRMAVGATPSEISDSRVKTTGVESKHEMPAGPEESSEIQRDKARNAKVDAELAREEAVRLKLDEGGDWMTVEKSWRLAVDSYSDKQWSAALNEFKAAESGAKKLKSDYETAKLKREQEEEYRKAKSAYEQALSAQDAEMLDLHGGAGWAEVKRLAKLGAESADNAAAGVQFYKEAFGGLPAVATVAEGAKRKAEEELRLAGIRKAYEKALAEAQVFERAGKWREAATSAEKALAAGWTDTLLAEALLERMKKNHGPELATKEKPWVNSLGMEFVPVSGVDALFCRWETRVKDFEEFVKETGYDATGGMYSLRNARWGQHGDSWKSPGFTQGPAYPVCGVSYGDATKFCEWLTEKEIQAGRLKAGQRYRLPTDAEWSEAVGLGGEQGETPADKHYGKIADVYPWNDGRGTWPPSLGAGNYGISLNVDNFDYTSPVGTFSGNQYGLFDMGGNVWEWCEDKYRPSEEGRVLRGASWLDDESGLCSPLAAASTVPSFGSTTAVFVLF